jgi:hypothetical protein
MSENPLTPFSQGSIGFLRRLFGPATTEIGEALADKVRAYRSKNLQKVLDKAEKLISSDPVEELPLRFSIPLIEHASREDDKRIQNIWANLLRSASEGITDNHYLMLRILSDLTPNSVDLLNKIVGKFFEREEWYEELEWHESWLRDRELYCLKTLEPKLDSWSGADEGWPLAQNLMKFHKDRPYWIFKVNLPAVFDDIKERVNRGQSPEDFGTLYVPFSMENPSLNILEREGLVTRRTHEFAMTYSHLSFTYVAATSIGVSLVEECCAS